MVKDARYIFWSDSEICYIITVTCKPVRFGLNQASRTTLKAFFLSCAVLNVYQYTISCCCNDPLLSEGWLKHCFVISDTGIQMRQCPSATMCWRILTLLYLCVYLGVKPGVISARSGGRRRSAPFPINSSTRHTCPVINCGRVYDNASLLDGHLKR